MLFFDQVLDLWTNFGAVKSHHEQLASHSVIFKYNALQRLALENLPVWVLPGRVEFHTVWC